MQILWKNMTYIPYMSILTRRKVEADAIFQLDEFYRRGYTSYYHDTAHTLLNYSSRAFLGHPLRKTHTLLRSPSIEQIQRDLIKEAMEEREAKEASEARVVANTMKTGHGNNLHISYGDSYAYKNFMQATEELVSNGKEPVEQPPTAVPIPYPFKELKWEYGGGSSIQD